jgi:RNA polymerase sigma-70 factor (ECF subfamily)
MPNAKDHSKSQNTIATVFLKYERAIKRVIGRVSKDRDDIDDLAQEAFLKAVIAEKRRPIKDPKAYLFATARNLAITEVSRKSRKVMQTIADVTDLNVSDNKPALEEIAIGRERYALFCEAVACLPPQCRTVFLMCKVYRKSHREIARTLAISVSTVEKHIGSGLAKCAAYIEARESGQSPEGQVCIIDKFPATKPGMEA